MQVEFLLENIEGFISLLSKSIPTHSQVPVLLNLLLEANKDGFFISATDLELGIKIKIPAKIENEGAVTIPGKYFLEVLTSLPKDKIQLSNDKEAITLTCRDTKVIFQTIPREEFPNLFEERGEEIYSFTFKEFKDIFSKLIFAVAIEESRPALTGIYLAQKENSLDFVVTDGFRMSLERIQDKKILEAGEGLILSSKLINEALSIKEDGETIKMYVHRGGNQVIFETEHITIVGRLIEGSYPPYEKVIPESSKTSITLERESFSQAIKLASIFARESANIVKVVITGDTLSITSKSQGVGEGDVRIEGKKEGEDNEISFNVKFLSDLLRNIDTKSILMQVNSGTEPALFTLEKNKSFFHIIMPVRIQE